MSRTAKEVQAYDPVWESLRTEAQELTDREPVLASYLHASVLQHARFEPALSFHLSRRLGNDDTVSAMLLREVFYEALTQDKEIAVAARIDLGAVRDRDPACRMFIEPFLHFKGYQALQAYRLSHRLWQQGRNALAVHVQSRVSQVFAVDIHPAAQIGKGIMMDHATGIVVGETAVVGDEVSMLHGVTLGGTGRETGQRHPRIGSRVLLGAGAKVLGNIQVGEGAIVGAGSVVVSDVPSCVTVAGVPARVVGKVTCGIAAREMDHHQAAPSSY